jgi:hypothetical protein
MSEYRSRNAEHISHTSSRQALSLVVLGLTGFLVSCLAINLTITRNLWKPDLGTYSDRLDALREHAADVDTIFLGSSHVQYGIDPVAYDESVARQGLSSSSFKLSVRSLSVPWVLHTLEELQRIDFPNLRQILIEPRVYPLSDLNSSAKWKNAYSVRSRFISGLSNTWLSGGILWSSNIPVRKKLLDSVHLAHNLALNVSNIGVLPNVVLQFPADQAAIRTEWLTRGGAAPAAGSIRSEPMFTTPDENAGYRPLSAAEVSYLNNIGSRVEKTGAETVFIFLPGRDDPGLRKSIKETLLNSIPPAKVIGDSIFTQASGTFSADKYWWDTDHLNQEGAKLFSAQLAEQWAELSRSTP